MNSNSMIDRLRAILSREGIEDYLIREKHTESRELYFIRRELDVARSVDALDVSVRVYRSFSENGAEYRGSGEVLIFESMTDDEIGAKLRLGYDACLYVRDEAYPPAPPVTEVGGDISCDLGEIAGKYADAIFSAESDGAAFVNSAEVFATLTRTRLVTPHGVDVSFSSLETSGETVVGCREGEDVELFDYFRYEGEQYSALSERVEEKLTEVRDRSHARPLPESGEYSVILEGECVREMLGYVLWRANARNVRTGYSTASVGQDAGGRLPDITATPTQPYSPEGLRMTERPLVRGGVLTSLVGSMRFCHYLGVPPTGEYDKLTAASGSLTLAQLREDKCLHLVSFSDFQFDPLDGYFGGEVRLGYLVEGGRVTPVSGFSVSGNYRALSDSFEFSSERCADHTYDGPRYMRISGVTAG